MADSPFIINVTSENFHDIVIQGSMDHLVLVDFWADWCAPCKMLLPVLSQLAEEYGGSFILAKVNSDEQQELALQYGVRSLPTVKFFKQGQIIDEFMGAQAEPQIRELLEQHIERESDHLHRQAMLLLDQGNITEAIDVLEQANETDPGRVIIIADLARLYLQQEQAEQAHTLLNTLSPADRERPEISSLLTTIELAQEVDKLPSEETLLQEIESDSANLEARYQLATLKISEGEYEAGIQQLLEIMKRDQRFNDGAAQEMLLKTFDMLGNSPLVAQYRRKMFTILH